MMCLSWPAPLPVQRGLKTAARIADNMPRLRALGIPSDMVEVGSAAGVPPAGQRCSTWTAPPACVPRQPAAGKQGAKLCRPVCRPTAAFPSLPQVPSRPINERWFSDRAPTISPEQSSAIVQALQELGVLDKEGWLADDPRAGLKVGLAGGGGTLRRDMGGPERGRPAQGGD